ncbi:MAG: ATP-binding cassette domain-containing protein, partial [Acetobacteraceae bacterium]
DQAAPASPVELPPPSSSAPSARSTIANLERLIVPIARMLHVRDRFGAPEEAGGDVTAVAARHGLIARPVRMSDARWWPDDSGPLLATRIADGASLALLPSRGGYQCLDGDGMATRIAATDLSRRLEADVWSFVRRPDTAGLPAAMLCGGAGPSMAAAAASALLAAAALLPVTALVLRLPAATPLLVVLPAILALPPLALAEARAAIRAEVERETATVTAMVARLGRLRARFALDVTPEQRMLAQTGVERLLRQAHLAARRLPGQVVTLAICHVLLVLRLPAAALPVAIVAAAGIAVPPLLTLLNSGFRLREAVARRTEAQFLATVIAAWARLRTLDAWTLAADRWRTLARDAQRRRSAAAPLRWVREGWQVILPVAGIALLSDGPVQPTAMSVAIGGLALISAAALGKSAAAWVAAWMAFHPARLLLDGPAEPGRAVGGIGAGEIALDRVSFRYSGTPDLAVADVSLILRPGRIVAITGRSGSGKTTLLNLILGLETPVGGTVCAGGRPLDALDLASWRRGIGAVLQRSRLDLAGTIRSQVAGRADAPEADVWAALRLAGVADAVAARPMGLQSIVEYSGLSGSEQQRLLIARALLRQPWLLVLDEATSAVAEDGQASLFAALRSRAIGCVLVTHRPSAIALADEVMVMRQGRVSFVGPPGTFLNSMAWTAMMRAEAVAR